MVLGCTLCRQPLLTYSYLKYNRKQKNFTVSLGPVKEKITDGHPDFPDEIREQPVELITTRCGHVFHRHCLKKYLAPTPGGKCTKRECPVCFKPICLLQCLPIYPKVNPDDLLTEKLRKLDKDNDELTHKLSALTDELRSRSLEVEPIQAEIANHQERIECHKRSIWKALGDPVIVNNITNLKAELTSQNKYKKCLSDQQSKLLQLIEQEKVRQQGAMDQNERSEDPSCRLEKPKAKATKPPHRRGRCRYRHPFMPCRVSSTTVLAENDTPSEYVSSDYPDSAFECQPIIRLETACPRRPTPKGAKYLEYRERKLMAEMNDIKMMSMNHYYENDAYEDTYHYYGQVPEYFKSDRVHSMQYCG